MKIDVMIPALNEEQALPVVLDGIDANKVRRVLVVDNGSTDGTSQVALDHGAEVLYESRRGYGQAVLSGMQRLGVDPPDILVFLDGDAADDPSELSEVVAPIEQGRADLVIGSRMTGNLAPGSMAPAQRIGNLLVPALLRILYRSNTTDLGPFRAIRWDCLTALGLRDRNYGVTVEMQIKAAKQGLRVEEVPVSYKPRIGESKVSGTLSGTVKATVKILWTVGRHLI